MSENIIKGKLAELRRKEIGIIYQLCEKEIRINYGKML